MNFKLQRVRAAKGVGMSTEERQRGLYQKFYVRRADNSPKHAACEYFVLDWKHDKHALQAIAAYIKSCKKEYPQLAADLLRKLEHYKALHSLKNISLETTR